MAPETVVTARHQPGPALRKEIRHVLNGFPSLLKAGLWPPPLVGLDLDAISRHLPYLI